MTLNHYMHPRNIYRVSPDFKDLALKYPDLRDHVQDIHGKARLDFKNPEALRALTTTLLMKDFDLQVSIPPDRLVPTLPSRLNYILWIEDLLATAKIDRSASEVLGLDIGTGATCIYPLLGSRKNGWRFLATDLDDEALQVATQNVLANQLQENITLIQAKEDSIISRVAMEASEPIDFSMCNPPFFRDNVEANSLTKRRKPSRPPPHAANTARSNESITDGGEKAFVAKMVEESATLEGKIKIYSTMFGKKSSVAEACKLVAEKVGKVGGSFVTTEFCQGRTMRWGVAWTFLPDVRIDTVTTIPKQTSTKKAKEKIAHPVGFTVPRNIDCCDYSVLGIREKIEETLDEIKMKLTKLKVGENSCALHFTANSNTWSHQRRKRRELMKQNSSKRIKLENEMEEPEDDLHLETPTSTSQEPVVEGMLFIRRMPDASIILDVQWIGGSLGKDAAHQILQFLKNKIR